MSNDNVLVRLSREEALVLHDFLARLNAMETLAYEDQAEKRVLWNVEAELESILDEPFRPDYAERLRKARDAVRDSMN